MKIESYQSVKQKINQVRQILGKQNVQAGLESC